ncbi:MAG: MMPL family transporter [Bacteroidota bacterium]
MEFILKNRRYLFIAICLLTLFMVYGLSFLRIDFSFDSFYPKEDPEYKYYEAYQELFSEEQNFVIQIAVESPHKDVFNRSFVQRIDSMFDAMEQLSGVDSMFSATNANYVRKRGLGFSQKPYFEYDTEEALKKSQKRILKDSTLLGFLVTNDLKHLCGFIIITPELFDAPERDVLHDELVDMLDKSGFEYVITGIPVIRTRYTQKLAQELIMFVSISVVLIVLVLFLMYRNLWGIIIPVLVILSSLLWITGTMGWGGQPINLINNLLIPIIFVVGMSDVIHLITKYLDEMNGGISQEEAMKRTLDEIGLATFLTSVTTAIGFASLMVSRIPPIREFGFYASIGVLFTYVISIVILPNAIMRLPADRFLRAKSLENHPIWHRLLSWVYGITTRKPKWVLTISALIIASCLALTTQISLDTYLLEDIGRRDPIRKSMEFFEAQSAGLRPFEMAIEVEEGKNIADLAVLKEMEKIQNFLQQEGYFSPFLSPVSLFSQANSFYNGNLKRYRRLPSDQGTVDEILSFIQLNDNSNLLHKVMNQEKGIARMSARMPDVGTGKFSDLTERLDTFIASSCDTTLFSYHITGHAYLTDGNLLYLRRSLLGGLGIAFIVIGIIMGLLFKSWRMLLISMVPNIIPLIITGGIMGLMGIKLTASTAIVFVISFGIAVDDTIHFLTRYKLERNLGKSQSEAIRETILGTGKAVIITSLVLMSGFVLLLASDFGGTFNTGLFTALTIIFAMLADLFLLPIFIALIDKEEIGEVVAGV